MNPGKRNGALPAPGANAKPQASYQATVQARLTAPDALHRAAFWYATQGIAVFPCAVRGKQPLIGRHAGGHGLHDATTDPAAISAWWTVSPRANIGLPTGRLFDVIDVDAPAGFASYLEMVEAGKVPPIIGEVYTGGGGRHVYIAASGRGNASALLPGVDYRGVGGYVIAPPSIGNTGRRYSWLQPLTVAA